MREEFWQKRAEPVLALCEQGLDNTEIASRLCISRQTVARYVEKYAPDSARTNGALVDTLRLFAAAGLDIASTAFEFAIPKWSIRRLAYENGIAFEHGGKGCRDAERLELAASMYRAGQTLEEIGNEFGVTRERIRQILSKYAQMSADDGGRSAKAAMRAERVARRKDDRCLQRYGCTHAQWAELVEIGKSMVAAGRGRYQCPTYAFQSQRGNAPVRGIEWRLTLMEWWSIWQASGKWEKRGRRRDAYVMCRRGDSGAYEVGNVYIATLGHNSTVQPQNPYRRDHPDFASTMRARRVVSRRTNTDCHSVYLGLPKGVTIEKRTGKFLAQISVCGRNVYLGSFPTSEAAHAAWMKADQARAA